MNFYGDFIKFTYLPRMITIYITAQEKRLANEFYIIIHHFNAGQQEIRLCST